MPTENKRVTVRFRNEKRQIFFLKTERIRAELFVESIVVTVRIAVERFINVLHRTARTLQPVLSCADEHGHPDPAFRCDPFQFPYIRFGIGTVKEIKLVIELAQYNRPCRIRKA